MTMTMTVEQLHTLLHAGLKHGASDIHFRVGAPPSYRVRGGLAPLKYEPLRPADTESLARLMIRDDEVQNQLGTLQELDTSYSVPGMARFRVNVHRQRGSLSLVLRIIPSHVPTLEELGHPAILSTIAEEERGLVLVAGATGSGKTSTLAAMIDHVNETRPVHILTIEDPIEFLHKNKRSSITQREIGIDTRNYNVALRSALRMDPDVILVGEMRDAESIDIALKASETGHMVFSTVHTTDATKTIGRLLSVFPGDEQAAVRVRLSENLKATISQRLLPRADGKGRVAAMEIMRVTGMLAEQIRDPARGGSLKDTIEKSRTQYGMQSFDQHLADLFHGGVITLETALSAATNRADFERSLHFSG